MALDLIAELEALVDALSAAEIDYALCGALSLAVHGHPRATKDIDLLVRDEDLDRVREVVHKLGFDLPAVPMTFDAGTAKERRVERVSKADEGSKRLIPLDMVVVTPVLARVWRERIDVAWRDRTLVTVSRTSLVEMKRLAGRPQDRVDVQKLESYAEKEDD